MRPTAEIDERCETAIKFISESVRFESGTPTYTWEAHSNIRLKQPTSHRAEIQHAGSPNVAYLAHKSQNDHQGPVPTSQAKVTRRGPQSTYQGAPTCYDSAARPINAADAAGTRPKPVVNLVAETASHKRDVRGSLRRDQIIHAVQDTNTETTQTA